MLIDLELPNKSDKSSKRSQYLLNSGVEKKSFRANKKVVVVFWMILIVVIPYFLTNKFVNGYTLRQAQMISLLGLGTLWWGLQGVHRLRLHILDYFVLAFTLSHFLSLPLAYDFANSFFSSQQNLSLAVLYFIGRVLWLRDPEFSKKAFGIAFIALSVLFLVETFAGLFRLSEYLSKNNYPAINSSTIYKLKTPALHKNRLALLLLLCFASNLYYVLSKDVSSRLRIVGLLLCWLSGSLVLYMHSRSAWLSFAFLLLSIIVFAVIAAPNRRRQSLLLLTILLLAVGSTYMMAVKNIGDSKGLESRVNPAKVVKSRSATERFYLWDMGWQIFKKNPLVGVGAGNWHSASLEQGLAGLQTSNKKVYWHPHNDFIRIADELGIVGLLGFVGLFVSCLIMLLILLRNGKKESWIMIIACSAVLAYGIASVFIGPRTQLPLQVLFFAFLIAAGSEYQLFSATRVDAEEQAPSKNSFALLFVLGLVLISTVANANYQYEIRSRIAKIKRLNKQKRAGNAIALQREDHYLLQSFNVQKATLHYTYGNTEERLGNLVAAKQQFESALLAEAHHYHSIWKLGRISLIQNDTATAGELFKRASAIYPHDKNIQSDLVRWHLAAGDTTSAKAVLEEMPMRFAETKTLYKLISDEEAN